MGKLGSKFVLYIYVGFSYRLWLDSEGRAENAIPIEGQHHSAGKDRHRRHACEQYNSETFK